MVEVFIMQHCPTGRSWRLRLNWLSAGDLMGSWGGGGGVHN